MPYVMQLIGEYIYNILDEIDREFDLIDADVLKQFVDENPRFMAQTKQRVISYWDCYYRQVPRRDYVGSKLIERIEQVAGTIKV